MRKLIDIDLELRNALMEHDAQIIPASLVEVDYGFMKLPIPSKCPIQALSIETAIDISPRLIGVIALKDTTLQFNNGSGYFCPVSKIDTGGVISLYHWSPFHHTIAMLKNSSIDSAETVHNQFVLPAKDTFVYLVSESGKEIAYLTNVVKGAESAVVSFDGGTCQQVYQQGDFITGDILTGKRINVYFFVPGINSKELLFSGIVNAPVKANAEQGSISLDHAQKAFFQSPLKITGESVEPIKRIVDGELVSSLRISAGCAGGISEEFVTIYPGATPGKWRLEFISSTSFKVSGPNCEEKEGNVYDNFYDQGRYDSQVCIDDAGWTGSFSEGDYIEFTVSVNFVDKTAVEHLIDLLSVYGDVAANQVDVHSDGVHIEDDRYTFNVIYQLYKDCPVDLSFESSTKIGDAITALGQHCLSSLYWHSGFFRLFTIHKDFGQDFFEGTDVDVSHHLIDVKPGDTEVCNFFIGHWGYDPDSRVFEKKESYPLNQQIAKNLFSFIEPTDIYFPGFHSIEPVQKCLHILFDIYSMGLQKIEIEMSLLPICIAPGHLIQNSNILSGAELLVTGARINLHNQNRIYITAIRMPI